MPATGSGSGVVRLSRKRGQPGVALGACSSLPVCPRGAGFAIVQCRIIRACAPGHPPRNVPRLRSTACLRRCRDDRLQSGARARHRSRSRRGRLRWRRPARHRMVIADQSGHADSGRDPVADGHHQRHGARRAHVRRPGAGTLRPARRSGVRRAQRPLRLWLPARRVRSRRTQLPCEDAVHGAAVAAPLSRSIAAHTGCHHRALRARRRTASPRARRCARAVAPAAEARRASPAGGTRTGDCHAAAPAQPAAAPAARRARSAAARARACTFSTA